MTYNLIKDYQFGIEKSSTNFQSYSYIFLVSMLDDDESFQNLSCVNSLVMSSGEISNGQ